MINVVIYLVDFDFWIGGEKLNSHGSGSSGVNIRRATPNDYPGIYRVLKSAWSLMPPYDPGYYEAEFGGNLETQCTLVATREEEIVAVGNLHIGSLNEPVPDAPQHNGCDGFFRYLAEMQESDEKGELRNKHPDIHATLRIGSALLNCAYAQGVRKCAVISRVDPLIKLLERVGFVKTGEKMHDYSSRQGRKPMQDGLILDMQKWSRRYLAVNSD